MSFQQGLSGLAAAAKNLEIIGNNVANANTVGFKESSAQFGDVFAASVNGGSGSNLQVGIGTEVQKVLPVFTQGNITVTQNPLDLAINGAGFYRISDNGTISYTRNGQFSLDKSGYIVNPQGRNLTGYAVDTSGTIDTANLVNLQLSRADLAPSPSTKTTIVLNLDATSAIKTVLPAFSLSNSATFNSTTSLNYFDGLGNPHTLSTYYRKTAANTWDVYAANDGVQLGAGSVGTVAFNNDGTLNTGLTTLPFNVSVAHTNGAPTPQAMAIDLSGSTQFGSPFSVNTLTTDGYASGKLTGYTVGADGTVVGRYSNGQTRTQGQVVIATFTNQEGLSALGQNAYAESPSSGAPLIGKAGSGNLGVIQSGAVEESSVDLTSELVKMITAQRVYQANAQTIKTQDAVLQTMVNLR